MAELRCDDSLAVVTGAGSGPGCATLEAARDCGGGTELAAHNEGIPGSIRDHPGEGMDSADPPIALAGSVDAAMFAGSWQSPDDASLAGDVATEGAA